MHKSRWQWQQDMPPERLVELRHNQCLTWSHGPKKYNIGLVHYFKLRESTPDASLLVCKFGCIMSTRSEAALQALFAAVEDTIKQIQQRTGYLRPSASAPNPWHRDDKQYAVQKGAKPFGF